MQISPRAKDGQEQGCIMGIQLDQRICRSWFHPYVDARQFTQTWTRDLNPQIPTPLTPEPQTPKSIRPYTLGCFPGEHLSLNNSQP